MTSIPAIFDIKTSTWSDPQAAHQPYPGRDYAKGVRSLSSTSSGVHYDTVNDVVVMRMVIGQGREPPNTVSKCLGLAIYDPEKNAWEEIKPLSPDMNARRRSWNSFYSPELNVHVYNLSPDSRTDIGDIWVYRYRKAGK